MAKKGYATKTDIENYILTTIDSTFDNQVDKWIESMENYVDQMTGRNFIADAEDHETDKYFDGDNSSKLLIDDCISVKEIESGEGNILVPDTTIMKADGDFVTYPANRLPITRIQLRGSYFPAWPHQGVRIKARWGYSAEVPADITQVVVVLVSGIINYGNNAEGEVKSMSLVTRPMS